MTIGTNDAVVKLGTQKTLEANGAGINNNTISAGTTGHYDIFTDGGGAPDAEFVLAVSFATAPAQNTVIDLFAQELDIDGVSDAQAPTATYRQRYVGSFVVNNVTGTQYLKVTSYDVPEKAVYYLYNNSTGQYASPGWTLKVTPRTFGPAA